MTQYRCDRRGRLRWSIDVTRTNYYVIDLISGHWKYMTKHFYKAESKGWEELVWKERKKKLCCDVLIFGASRGKLPKALTFLPLLLAREISDWALVSFATLSEDCRSCSRATATGTLGTGR